MTLTLAQQKLNANAWLAQQFVGITDKDNGGYLVRRFQRAVDGTAATESWCAIFARFCATQVDELFDRVAQEDLSLRQGLAHTDSTQELFKLATPPQLSTAAVGCVAVWQELANPWLGHCGIVTAVEGEGVYTVEGNTSGQPGEERTGGCVWMKTRDGGQIPGFHLLGYLNPWGA